MIDLNKSIVKNFRNSILEFQSKFDATKPWQSDRNPYKIWLLEVLSQQTRMVQAMPYYDRIIEAFPNIEDLAQASEDELFSLWKGLGYYSRARNLHYTAKYISKELKGNFPKTYAELLRLKGVGEYTAAAIASFAYKEDIAVLDGNVHRVLSRVFGIYKTIQSSKDKAYFQSMNNQLLSKGKSDLYNQGLMNFGSYICSPQSPKCLDCPLSSICHAYINDRISSLPPKKLRIQLKERYFYQLFVLNKGNIYLKKRMNNDIWKGLYEGIVQEGIELDPHFWLNKGVDISQVDWSDWQKQTLSHQKIFMKMSVIDKSFKHTKSEDWKDISLIKEIPFPRLVSKWWEKINTDFHTHG